MKTLPDNPLSIVGPARQFFLRISWNWCPQICHRLCQQPWALRLGIFVETRPAPGKQPCSSLCVSSTHWLSSTCDCVMPRWLIWGGRIPTTPLTGFTSIAEVMLRSVPIFVPSGPLIWSVWSTTLKGIPYRTIWTHFKTISAIPIKRMFASWPRSWTRSKS